MRGRLSTWLCTKWGLLSAAILVLFAVFQGDLKLRFISKIIILNSSSSIVRHHLSPPYPYPYKFLINQPQKCERRNPFLVLLVITDSHNVKSRNTIRKTWGNESNYREIDVLKIFLVGLSPAMTGAVQGMLEEESTKYGDIVQQDFLDTYYNLSLKTLMGMQWVSTFCPNASYAMKIDSDVFLNVNFLVHQLLHPELPAHENYFTGLLVYFAVPIRKKENKWYIPENMYPGDIFPPYPAGPGYVFSVDMARKVYNVAQEILVLSVEDAFMGMCLHKLKILPIEPPKNVFIGHRIEYDRCIFHNVIMVHHYENEELQSVWSDFWGENTLGC